MELHISRAIREKLKLDDLLFSYTGNVVFANVAASRKLAGQLSELRGPDGPPVNAGALFAMGLIDELNHALVARYRKEIDPAVLTEAMKWLAAKAGAAALDKMLLAFTEEFPNVAVFRGEVTAAEWLKGTTEGLPNREAALEELLLLWLSNVNPALKPFKELFGDEALKEKTAYSLVTASFADYFESRPPVSPEIGSLLDALRAPVLASPDSLTGQLDFMREHWSEHVGTDLKRMLLAIDTVREEDLAIWMRFHPPGPEKYRHGAPGRGGEGFVGDEYIGFEDAYVTGPDGVRKRRYATDYQAPLVEYEAFSADQAWMPNVVLMAKSTYVWLEQLSKKYQRHIHRLDQIPDEELQLLARRGITALWLIGLWERSTASRTIKRLRGHADAVASAYSLKGYDIAEDLGGTQGYESLRNRAAAFGLRLASDMVPNHMGIDSDWVIENPDWFIYRWESPFPAYKFEGPDLSTDSRVEIKIEDHYFDQTDAAVVFRLRHHADGATRYMYHGNDGTTFAWNDTAQIDYSKAYVREHVIQTILHVARLFPIIRFDAAMVLAKRHVQRLWFPLPGAGGSIPSRAENAMSQEEFEALMPHEFWREVVDRVAVEVPGTLLLAEAFWLLEGYFVRTLGMHRVYNSAFMNMLRDEENAKYRSYLKKTIEFDPDILKRYVNFMSNPDERTAIDQFGSGDKFFGVSTLLATLPGLPMFGHGQIEGYTERYGMEFKQAKMDEWPNEYLVERHQRQIAPLLKNRRIFAESTNFFLYDFWTGYGEVNENVFAYSNKLGGDRSIVIYNNAYQGTQGTIHISAASVDKGSGELRQRSLADGLEIPGDDAILVTYRDPVRELEYLRRAVDFHRSGLTVDLGGYQCITLLNWRDLRSTAEEPWGELCDSLGGSGVASVDEALSMLQLRSVHEALRQAVSGDVLRTLAELAGSAAPLTPETIHERLRPLAGKSEEFCWRVFEHLPGGGTGSADVQGDETVAVDQAKRHESFLQAGGKMLKALVGLASGEAVVSAEDAAVLRRVLPKGAPANAWAPVVAWAVLSSLPWEGDKAGLFDSLHLRKVLAEAFAAAGLGSEDKWRAAARVRLLLAQGGSAAGTSLYAETLWTEPDVRWLAGIHEAAGTTYMNKESFEEVLGWLLLPALVGAAEAAPGSGGASAGKEFAAASEAAESAGYKLREYLTAKPAKPASSVGLEAAAPGKVKAKTAVKAAAKKTAGRTASAKPAAEVVAEVATEAPASAAVEEHAELVAAAKKTPKKTAKKKAAAKHEIKPESSET